MVNNHTFVVCAYKESQYLEECVRSLLNQTIKSNIIVTSSTPNKFILDICHKYNLPFYEITGGGIGKDWNSSLRLVKTKYATIAHQDDIYLPNYLEEIMKNGRSFLIAFTGYNEINNEGIIVKNKNLLIKKILLFPIKLFPTSVFFRRRSLSFGCAICCPSVTYNLSLLGDFKFDTNLKVDLDWDAWERISKKKGRFLYKSSSLMCHRIHSESETTKRIEDNQRTIEDKMMFSKFWPNFIVDFLMKPYSKSQSSNS